MRSTGGSLSLIELDEGNGNKELALLKDMQTDSVKDTILHLDFVQVTRGQSLETKVPLELIGESPGVKNMSGILEFHQDEILVRCRPSNLPKSLVLDISTLELEEVFNSRISNKLMVLNLLVMLILTLSHVLVVQVVVQGHLMMRLKIRISPKKRLPQLRAIREIQKILTRSKLLAS